MARPGRPPRNRRRLPSWNRVRRRPSRVRWGSARVPAAPGPGPPETSAPHPPRDVRPGTGSAGDFRSGFAGPGTDGDFRGGTAAGSGPGLGAAFARARARNAGVPDGRDPFGHGYADTYRPAYEARTPGHPAPDIAHAPGGPAAFSGPGATGGPRLPRPAAEAPGRTGTAAPAEGAGRAWPATVADGSAPAWADTVVLAEAIAGAETVAVTLPGPAAGPPGEAARPGGGRADARRAARRRRVTDRPDALRRLLPQALVVAFLAGGTSAFVADDKAIELSVDGHPRTLHTFADDVTELLDEEGVEVGPHDVVAPAPGTAARRRGRGRRCATAARCGLTLDGTRRQVWTTARHRRGGAPAAGGARRGRLPVGVALAAHRARGARARRADRAHRHGHGRRPGPDHPHQRGDASARPSRQAGITLHGQDTTSVPPESFPRDGQTVTVLRITGTRGGPRGADPVRGAARATTPRCSGAPRSSNGPGSRALRRVTYSLRTVNGVREKPRRIGAEVVREPRTQLVRVGHEAAARRPCGGADHLNWAGLAACESGGRPGAVDPSGTYGGLYQFDTRTWHGLGGSGRPQDASAAEQTLPREEAVRAREGASPWPHCGARLHG